MASTALILYLVYLATAFGLRSWIHWRRTGSSGFRAPSRGPGAPEWWAGTLFLIAVLGGLAAPILQLTGLLEPIALFDNAPAGIVGAVCAFTGIAGTLVAQHSMGEAWRVGVDAGESTSLVRSGAFSVVRNPVFTAMLVAACGLALLAPNPLALGAFGALLIAIELQVRIVEEPHLRRLHGNDYGNYAAEVGRFVPRFGRTLPARDR